MLAPRDVERSVKESLAQLRLDEIDLLLIHWPNPRVPLAETLGAMAKLKQLGLVRALGVSNFTVALLDEAAKVSPEPLVCNQIEMPSLPRPVEGHRRLQAARHGGRRL